MIDWLPPKSDLKHPRYRSLAQIIESAIDSGTLGPGARLPTHRELAYQLGISIQTASRAYSRLVEGGKIRGEVGRGTFVRPLEAAAPMPFPAQKAMLGTLDLSLLKPVTGSVHEDAMKATLKLIAKEMPEEILTSFRSDTVVNRHAVFIDHWLALCGVVRRQQAIIPTNGNTSAMTVALLSVARSGDLIVAERMGHHTLPSLCRCLGMRLKGIETDHEGMKPEALDAACQIEQVKAIYVMPRSNPMICGMSEERRRDIIRVAELHDIAIIENDGWGPLERGGARTFCSLAPERCYYFTGLTKCLAPGLRVGFLVAPEAAATTVKERHMVTNWMVTPLMMEIAAQWISDGTAEQLLNWQRSSLAVRGKVAKQVLGGFNINTGVGLMAWLPCPDAGSEARLVESARNEGILISPGSTFSIGTLPAVPGVRISLGPRKLNDLRKGLEILAGLAAEITPPIKSIPTL